MLVLVAELHGKASAQRVAFLANQLAAQRQNQRSHDLALVEYLLSRLRGGSPVLPWDADTCARLEQAIAEAQRGSACTGREADRKIRRVLRLLFALTELHSIPTDPGLPFVERLEQAARMVIDERTGQPTAGLETQCAIFARYALCFPATRDVARFETSHLPRAVVEQLAGMALTLDQALGLTGLELKPYMLHRIAPLVANGVLVEDLERAKAVHPLDSLFDPDADAAMVTAWCRWVSRLVPHYARMGVQLTLPVDLFARTRLTRNDDLEVLLHCLMSTTSTSGSALEQALSNLDTTLSLFQGVPQHVRALVRGIHTVLRGLGRKVHPEFARWLDDDEVLDRYLHLTQLVEGKPRLSRALLDDFTHADRRLKQIEHLQEVKRPTAKQGHQLLKLLLEQDADTTPSSQKTRRRMADRVPALLVAAWNKQQDQLIRSLIKETWNISVKHLTPAWRIALRFHMSTDRNRDLLATLLRFCAAAPGHPIGARSSDNQCWLRKARQHMDVDAWLAPRHVEFQAEGQSYRAYVEQDPLEVLQMGCAFRTCLALESGFNAPSTVINALDANKKVIYVRDPNGSILARKLVGISTEWTLVGYRLYCAVTGELHEKFEAAVATLCQELASVCGVPLSGHGTPEVLHQGFWYDDGNVAFEAICGDPVDPWCATLGRPHPTRTTHDFDRQASLWNAWRKQDVQACRRLRRRETLLDAQVGAWMVERLGVAEALRHVDDDDFLRWWALRAIAQRDPPGTLRAMEAMDHPCWWFNEVFKWEAMQTATAEIALTWLDAAEATVAHQGGDEHSLAHDTFYRWHSFGRQLPCAEFFRAVERIDCLWSRIVETSPGCSSCRAEAVKQLMHVVQEMDTSDGDVMTIVRALGSGGGLARILALQVAATSRVGKPPQSPLVLRALDALANRDHALASHPGMFAARLLHTPRRNWKRIPLPDTAPFEVLGPLVLEVPAEMLEPWSHGRRPWNEWKPGPWELAFLRRNPMGVARQLLNDAKAGDEAALQALALLGLAPQLDEALKTPRTGPRLSKRAEQRCIRICERIRAQLDQGTVPNAMDKKEPRPEHWLDAAIVHHALEVVGDEQHHPDLAPAVTILRAADLDEHTLQRTLRRVGARKTTNEAIHPLLEHMLTSLSKHRLRPSFRVLVRLWQQPALRDAITACLTNPHEDHWPAIRRSMQDAAIQEGLPLDVDVLASAWFAKAQFCHPNTFDLVQEPLDLCEISRWMCRHMPVDAWMDVYQDLHDVVLANALLDALKELPDQRRQQLAMCSQQKHWNEQDRWLQEWLLDALANQPLPST